MNRAISLLLVLMVLWTAAAHAESCEDGVCPLPLVNENNEPVYAIVSPVGYHAVEPIKQAPRLDTL